MKHKIIIVVIAVITIATNSCKDNGTGPETLEPGRRDYVWSVDTLNLGGNYPQLRRIWGSSPNDVYVVGEGSPSEHNVWHFDGNNWSPLNQSGYFNLAAIYGFGKNNVWIGSSDNGEMYHYNGTTWKQTTILKAEGYGRMLDNNLWGPDSNDIYASCTTERISDKIYVGMLFHYDGVDWKRVEMPDYEKNAFIVVRKDALNNFVMTTLSAYNNYQKVVEWDGKSYTELCNTTDGVTLINIGEKIYYSCGKKVYVFENGSAELWHDFTGTEFKGLLGGRNERDIFTKNADGIGHYNGTDLKTIYSNDFLPMWSELFDTEVFFTSLDGRNGKPVTIVHGKITN